MGGKSSTSTTTVKNLPDYCTPYVVSYLERSAVLSRLAYAPYGGTTVAAQNADETDGIAGLALRGRNGNVTITKGIAFVLDTLQGDYLPGTDTPFQNSLSKVSTGISDSFTNEVLVLIGVSGVILGDPSGENVAQNLCSGTVSKYSNRVQAALYAKNHRVGRIDQHQGLEFGPEYASQPYRDAELLRAAGLYQREYDQSVYLDTYNKWVDAQVWRVQRLEILGNAIRALVGTQYSKTEPVYTPSKVVAVAGGAMAGAAMGAYIGSAYPVVGTAIGAVVGGLMGYLSSG